MDSRILGSFLGTAFALVIACFLFVLTMPATVSAISSGVDINVTTTTDEFNVAGTGTGCSLREAIETSNTGSNFGGCIRVFNLSPVTNIFLPSGNYTLTIMGAGEDANVTGDLDISRTVVISATGGATPTVTSSLVWDDRIFHVRAGSLTIKTMVIDGGSVDGDGGGILFEPVAGALTLDNVTFRANSITGNGGGAYISGTLALNGTRFLNNGAGGSGGGLYVSGPLTVNGGLFQNNYAVIAGGGLYVSNTLAISGTHFINNSSGTATAGSGGGGASAVGATFLTGALFQNNSTSGITNSGPIPLSSGGGLWTASTLEVIDSQFLSNTADLDGGGLYAGGGLTLFGGVYQGNSAKRFGGGLHANGVTSLNGGLFYDNAALAYGGGVSAFILELTGTQFISNSAYTGGGVVAEDTFTLHDGSFQHNRATTSGGGLYAYYSFILTDTQFISNTAASGGGAVGQSATLTGGLFRQNSATNGSGGGLEASVLMLTGTQFISNTATSGGGGVSMPSGRGRVVNALFARNVSYNGHGAALLVPAPLLIPGPFPVSKFVILHTTITGPTSLGGSAISIFTGTLGITDTIISGYPIGVNNVGGAVYENYNLFFGNGTDKLGTAGGTNDVTGLDPNFEDPALYNYHLSPGSPAINKGINAGVFTDIDGDVRPQGAGFDIGADEFFFRLLLPLIRR